MEDTEGLNEWEQIQSPWSQTGPKKMDETLVFRDNHIIFAPNNHEGLLSIPPQNDNQPSNTSSFSASSSSSSVTDEGDEVGPVSFSGEIGRRLRLRLGAFSYNIRRIACVVRDYKICRGAFWSFVSVAGVVGAVLVSVARRWRKRVRRESKDRLMVIIREKDEKISQLLLQIAQMSEILSTRRRVPVLRVN